ncbi:DUF3291 domain-containing protein [Dactylosporangium sp. NPDC051541]|uniref:DUF3291 domain-containing protein n=1 Tax=Dactylosporangium sp. NPDC051541 TaxID=3363977 RepID=UPI0037A5DB5F
MRLAQVNVARMRGGPEDAVMAGFMAAVEPVYRLAEGSPGFVWRLHGAGGHVPTCADAVDGWLVVNVSVWTSYEALHQFVYRSHHGGLVRRRGEWFLPTPQPSTALWWVADDERPGLDAARARLRVLRREGASPRAFSLRRRFEADGTRVAVRDRSGRGPNRSGADRV